MAEEARRPQRHRSALPADRFAPPEVQTLAVARPRLGLVLDLAVHHRLTLVVAPPGYGKTVLLSEWAAAHPSRRIRWLALGPEHDDLATFARDLRDALGAKVLTLDPSRAARRPATEPDGRRSALRAELESVPPTTLVLEDLHVVTNPAIHAGLALLIEHAPRAVHIVVSTRVDPPVPYHRLGLSDLLVELRQEDLAFTAEEATELVHRLTGIQLLPAQAEALVAQTEGWAVGLQLAALSLRSAPDVDEFVTTFTGYDHRVVDYLTERVLQDQPESVQRFLLDTSVLERMSGPLCDFVTQRHDGQAMLEELDRQSMFITRLDARGHWFRFHALFRALLRHHLHAQDPDLEHALLARAAEWHLARDDLDTAVRYLADAGAWDDVLGVASAQGRTMLGRGRAATVASWIELVPRSVTDGRVDVQLLEAAALAFGGEVARAAEVLDAIDGVGALSAGQAAVADLVRAWQELQHGDPAAALDAADRAQARAGDLGSSRPPDVLGLTRTPADVVVAAGVVRGLALVFLGRFEEARDALEGDLESADGLWQIAALGARALLEAWSGRLVAAERLGTRALALAEQLTMADDPVASSAHLALVVAAVERNEFERAHQLLEESARSNGLSSVLLPTERALLALAEGEPDDGLLILADHAAAETPLVPKALVARRCAVEAQLLAAEGDLDGAARALDRSPVLTTEVAAARARVAVERGDIDAARALTKSWPAEPGPRAVLERDIWTAVVEHLDGDERSAGQRAAAVLTAAEFDHDVGLFRGHHPLGPLRALYRTAPTPFLRAVIEQPVATPRVRPVRELVEQLTQREYMVLTLLPSRMSNAEIADSLGISLNTAKTHLKHIYRKFAVAERSEAVAAAERLGLL